MFPCYVDFPIKFKFHINLDVYVILACILVCLVVFVCRKFRSVRFCSPLDGTAVVARGFADTL